jgi:hypothetical protein
MKISKLGYFSEFLLFPPLVLVATLLVFRSSIPPSLQSAKEQKSHPHRADGLSPASHRVVSSSSSCLARFARHS